MNRVTFATSSGIVWLTLMIHFAAGLFSIIAGTISLSTTKGGRLHKRSGLVFTLAMIILGLTAAGIGIYEERPGQVFGGLLATYLVITGTTTVKSLPRVGRPINLTMMGSAFVIAVSIG